MTHEEAIKRLTYYKKPDWIRRLFMRLNKKAVKEADELNALCVEAIEKQIPKKPKPFMTLAGVTRYSCPNCVLATEDGYPYCQFCGQHIKWKDEE